MGWMVERVALVQMVFKYLLRARASEEAFVDRPSKFHPIFI
jgi:hypothetical protein